MTQYLVRVCIYVLWGVIGGNILGCSLKADIFARNKQEKLIIDDPETVSTYINDSNQGHFPISGKCPKGATEVILESPVTATFPCVNGEFAGEVNVSALLEGEHSFLLRPDIGEPATWLVIKDITPPAVTLDSLLSFVNLSNVSAFPVSGTCSESGRFVYIETVLLRLPVLCSQGIFSGALDLSSLSEGAVNLKASQADAAGNEASSVGLSTEKDTIRPDVAAITNLPKSPSPLIVLNSSVSGTDVTAYSYKVGLASTESCSDISGGYSSFRDVSTNLVADISVLPDTSLKLCVWTKDIAGNQQLSSDVFEYTWIKDSTIALATLSAFNPAGNISNAVADRTVTVGGVNISHYKAVTLFNQSDCSSVDFSGVVETPVSSDFTFSIGSDGAYIVCVIGKNIANNWQPVNAATASDLLVIDRVQPSLTLSSGAPATFNTSSVSLTATFSEAVTGFAQSDVTVSNGTLSGFIGSGANYTFTVTPSSEGPVTVAVGAGVAQDAATNFNLAASTLSRIYDSIAPTVTLNGGSANINGVFMATLTFSEAVTGVALGDFVVTNAILTGLAGGPSIYTVTVTPTVDGAVNLQYQAHQAQDAGGNSNTASNTLSLNYDGIAPTLSLYSLVGDPFKDSSFDVIATFSESVTGFALSDIVVTNGTASALSGSGTTYTFTITPSAQGLVTVAVGAGVATDAAGNGNTATTNLTRTYDSVAPTIMGLSNDVVWAMAKTWSWGCSETCTYRHIIDTNASTTPTGTFDGTTAATQSSGTGTYYIHVQAQDSVGNTSIVHVSALLDNTNPNPASVISDGITINSLIQSPTITFTSGTDSHSGIQKHQLRVLRVSDSFVMKDWHDFTSGNPVTGLSLATDTAYKVEVRAIDNVDLSSTTVASDGWIADTSLPSAPTGLSLGSVPSSLTTSPPLSWSAASDGSGSGVVSYQARIFRTSDSVAMSSWVSLATGNSITGMTLIGGTQYYFKVRAIDGAGNVGSESTASGNWTAVSCTPGSQTFIYSGVDQTFTVPSGCSSVTVKMWGAGGGGNNFGMNTKGGGGGYATGVLSVTPGESLTVIVGQGGRISGSGTYGGGGGSSLDDYNGNGGEGGGRSAIRRSGIELITAGGGGGGAYSSYIGGAGGGTTGLSSPGGGGGGTQSSGGSAGVTVVCDCGGGSDWCDHYSGQAGSAFLGGQSGIAGGGGGGYFGGGSGGWCTFGWFGDEYGTNFMAGGGGASYVGGVSSGVTQSGSGETPGNVGDGERAGAGAGGSDGAGANGLVILRW